MTGLGLGILTAAGIGANLLQYRDAAKIANQNIKREQKAAEFRAQDRRQLLRESLSAARVMAVAQGSNPGVGSNLNLQSVSLQNFMTDSERDRWQTAGVIESLQNRKLTAALNAISGVSNSLLTASSAYHQTLGAPPRKP